MDRWAKIALGAAGLALLVSGWAAWRVAKLETGLAQSQLAPEVDRGDSMAWPSPARGSTDEPRPTDAGEAETASAPPVAASGPPASSSARTPEPGSVRTLAPLFNKAWRQGPQAAAIRECWAPANAADRYSPRVIVLRVASQGEKVQSVELGRKQLEFEQPDPEDPEVRAFVDCLRPHILGLELVGIPDTVAGDVQVVGE